MVNKAENLHPDDAFDEEAEQGVELETVEPPLSPVFYSTDAEYFAKSQAFELSQIEALEKSRKMGWVTALGLGLVAIAQAVALAVMMPLKEKVPYVIHTNTATGQTTILPGQKDKIETLTETADKSWVKRFIVGYESYNWYTVQKDYDDVILLSAPNVAKDFDIRYSGPNALDKKYGANIKIDVDVISIVLSARGIATVRYTKTLKHTNDNSPVETTYWVATVTYEYDTTKARDEKEAVDNPPGFVVLNVRFDQELAGNK